MVVSSNVLAIPKQAEFKDFEANGLRYHYKKILELNHADLVVEIILCNDEQPSAYLSPTDFDEQETQMYISNEILKFLQELNILAKPEVEEEVPMVTETETSTEATES